MAQTQPLTLHDYYLGACLSVLAHPEVHVIGLLQDLPIPDVHDVQPEFQRIASTVHEFARALVAERNRLEADGNILEPNGMPV